MNLYQKNSNIHLPKLTKTWIQASICKSLETFTDWKPKFKIMASILMTNYICHPTIQHKRCRRVDLKDMSQGHDTLGQ